MIPPSDIPAGYVRNTDRDAVVGPEWFYSYDGGGITGVIPEYAPVKPEWVGKTVTGTGTAWEYFYKPSHVTATVIVPIPVDDIAAFARQHHCDLVVLLAYDGKSQMSHIVTWGSSDELSASAASLGNDIKDGLGWPKELHADPPIVATLKAEIAALKAAADVVAYQNECDAQEDAQHSLLMNAQKNCPHSHAMEDLDPEDGCVHCGFYTK